jgi:hypothetical protein
LTQSAEPSLYQRRRQHFDQPKCGFKGSNRPMSVPAIISAPAAPMSAYA